jgi:SAM-dependent methyltransferase
VLRGKIGQKLEIILTAVAWRPVSTSLVYRSARAYELLMRALYGRHYDDRLRAVAEQVPHGSEVLELCCGPGTLYLRHLRGRVRSYVGMDVNDRFVQALRARGVDARVLDLRAAVEPLPPADAVLMQASLYHFLPDAAPIVDRMLRAARERVVISEPVRNLTSSELPVLARLGASAADPGVGGHAQRFTAASLAELMQQFRPRQLAAFPIPGGREMVYVLDARPPRRSGTAGGS